MDAASSRLGPWVHGYQRPKTNFFSKPASPFQGISESDHDREQTEMDPRSDMSAHIPSGHSSHAKKCLLEAIGPSFLEAYACCEQTAFFQKLNDIWFSEFPANSPAMLRLNQHVSTRLKVA